MAEQLLSDDWYRVAKLRPSVRSSVQIARHSYRGVIWYVLHDPVNGRHHRVNRTAYELLARLDGSTTVDTVWRDLLERLGDDAPTQGDVLQALAQLNEAQLLHGQLAPDARQLERRAGERRRAATLGAVNPLSFRLMLFDPSAILVRLDGLARTLFSVPGAWAWGALAALAALVALVNLSELFATASAAWREPRFLFVMWIIYPLLKIAHEFSHGMAVRRYGGTVTELGVRLLVLTPVPYVDASSSTLFADKRERALVAAAGIAAELLIASLAVFVWAIVEDGLVREASLAAIVIGSVSTLAFNGNPLLRFDAYYVLADLLEIPNLGPRSSAYWRYLAQHRLLGLKSVKAPPVGPGEVPWLIGYGAASWVYRLFVFGAISIFIADIHWTLGAMVIAGGIWTLLLRPAWKGLEFVTSSPALSGKRQGALATVATGTLVALLAVLFVPVPFTTVAEGVVWLPEKALVRPVAGGFVTTVHATDGQPVRPGTPILTLANPVLEADLARAQAEVEALEVERVSKLDNDPLRMAELEEKIAAAQAAVTRTRRMVDGLTVRADANGRLALNRPQDLQGRFLAQGEVVGHIMTGDPTTVRVALENELAPRVRGEIVDVAVRLREAPGREFPARVETQILAATDTLPSAALGDRGGGTIPTLADDPAGLRARQPVFLVDVALQANVLHRAGGTALVRFDHGSRSLAQHAAQQVRRVLLRHFES
ncbi:MAG: PqqD family peptide modification chaperone [Burkholderiaceae bacterium]|nr:PqqD family peptide modification chaperone [Burkholderiaceae bacterium]